MDTIVSGVYQVPGYARSYIIDGDEGVTLIDTGLPGRHRAIVDVLAAIGRSPADIRAIAVTHSHADHVGGAAALKRETTAPLFASAIDAPAIRGEEPSPPPPALEQVPFIESLLRLVPRSRSVDVDQFVAEGDTGSLPEDLAVVDTPGHTPGHVSFLLDRGGGALFVGDAAMSTKSGEVKRGFMNRSTPTFDASLRHIAEFEFEVAFFGHSERLTGSASAAFQRFAASLP